MTSYLIILTNTSSKDEAQSIANALVSKRLASSVNIIGPLASTYWWQGTIVTSEEWQCQIKTYEDRYNDIEQLIQSTHSYQVPGIVALPVVAGSKSYLDWILRETRGDSDSGEWL